MSAETIRHTGGVSDLQQTDVSQRTIYYSPSAGPRIQVAVEVSRGGRSPSIELTRETGNTDLIRSSMSPRPTERVASPVSNDTLTKEPPPSKRRGSDCPSWMFWRPKQGAKESGVDKALNSLPVAVQEPKARVFQRHCNPRPSRPYRPVNLPSISPNPSRAIKIQGRRAARPPDIKIRGENLGRASVCFDSHPPELPVSLPVDRPMDAHQPDLARIAQCEKLGRLVQVALDDVMPHRSPQRDSLSAFSTTAIVDDALVGKLDQIHCTRHRSGDGNSSTTVGLVAPKGAAVSGYTSFPKPLFKNPGTERSNKQAWRHGMFFSPADSTDPTNIAGMDYDEDHGFNHAGFDQEPQVVETPTSGPSQAPQILVTPPSRPSSMVSCDGQNLLSVEHAWKRIAERASRQARMDKEELENLRAYTAPLMAAFEVVRSHPEFYYLDTWDSIEEVLLKILQERDTNSRERDMALRAARWFEREWMDLARRTRALEEETEESETETEI